MRLNFKTLALAGLLASGTALGSSPASAQMAASLPDKETVQRGEATDADGTYVVSTIDKRITIEEGRGYVIDPWTQALFWRVKPGMVTLQNFRQTGPDEFEADDLPMMGKVVFYRQPNGTLQGVVKGAMGEAKYALVPTAYATVSGGDSPSGGGELVTTAPDRIYKLHVSGSRCTGTELLRKNYGGVFSISLVNPDGDTMQSKNRNFSLKCTSKGPRKQSYNYYKNGAGSLTLTVPADAKDFRSMRVRGENKRGKNFTINRAHSSLLTRAINQESVLGVGEKLSDEVELHGKKAKLRVTLTLERVQ